MLKDMLSNNALLISAVSLWALGVASILLRKVPSRLYSLLKSFFVVTLTVNRGNEANSVIMDSIIQWYMSTSQAKHTRKLILEGTTENRYLSSRSSLKNKIFNSDFLLSPGMGMHFFRYKKTFGWVTRAVGKDATSTLNASEIVVNFLTYNNAVTADFLQIITAKTSDDTVEIYAASPGSKYGDWKLNKDKFRRELSSVIVKNKIKENMITQIEKFFDSKEWYQQKGINYKLTYLLHGQPGTGKSSLIFSLACHFNKKLYLINMSDITSSLFEKLISEVPEKAILVLEDFQIANTAVIQDDKSDTQAVKPGLTLSTVLNVLDGVNSISDNLVFLTTNHIGELPESVLRKGRVDHIVEIELLGDAEVKEYIQLMYPEQELDHTTSYKDIAGCDVQALFLANKDDYKGFTEALKERSYI